MQRWQYWDESSLSFFLNNFPLIISVFININEYANHENTTTWIFDHEMKVLCPSINLVPLLVVYDKSRWDIIDFSLVNHIFNVLINIYE